MRKIHIENVNNYITVDDMDFETISKYKGIENAYQKVKNLDFRRENIGIDKHMHRYRKPQRNSSSKYKGVRRMKMNSGNYTWISSISFDGKRKHLGCFNSEIEAAKAYNKAVVTYWNGNGYLNDI